MIDLSGIARHLRLNADQIRVAADLLEQGYCPTFIARYRGDETGQLPENALWRLKFELDRRQRIQAARERAIRHLPKDAMLDQEAENSLSHAHTSAAMESALKCFRARRALEHSQERDGAAGKLLEAMVTYSGAAVDNPIEWAARQLSLDAAGGEAALSQAARLIAALIQGDTALNEKLRQTIHRRAMLRVGEYVAPTAASPGSLLSPQADDASETSLDTDQMDDDHDINDVHASGTDDGDALDQSGSDHDYHDSPTEETLEHDDALSSEGSDSADDSSETDSGNSDDLTVDGKDNPKTAKLGSTGNNRKSGPAKPFAKLTPRQRRRRWLAAMLAPLRSLNKPLGKLSHYQFLMLARGVRSQLVALTLEYDPNLLVDVARNSFTDAKHPWATWISGAIAQSLENGMRSKLEADVLAECDEVASESLLEHAADELRNHLLRRPVRGHTIALLDTVGPKTVAVIIVSPSGDVLACEEIACGVQPEIISQNVVKLGELIHLYRVTLVALTNGPARRFVVLTLRELMQQSKDSGLRWTMADRSGAEAYAGSRIGLRELSTYNRRQRAAIWAARCLQDPLVELLKADSGRLRLGSYQRELPQEPLRKLVQETIVDCVSARGVDARSASERELQLVPGVGPAQAKQIVSLSASGQLTNRQHW
jgi:transcriptional accessory protein Tex/SPT6